MELKLKLMLLNSLLKITEEIKMWKKILLQLGKVLLNFGLSLMFNAVDKNADGKLSKEEIHNFVVDTLEKIYKKK